MSTEQDEVTSIRPADDEGTSCSRFPWLFAALCFCYHCEGSMGQIIEGCDGGDHGWYQVCWEYDLEAATGNVSIMNTDRWPHQGDLYKLTGLIPWGVKITATHGIPFGWGDLDEDACIGMTGLSPGEPIGMPLPTGDDVSINFTFPVYSQVLTQPAQLEHFWSAPNCLLGFSSTESFENFVSVAPITCINYDIEPDSDNDLADFAGFQNNVGLLPESANPSCLEDFIDNFSGPALTD